MWSAQGVVVPGEEALLMTPRRFASPMRWCDLEPLFGRTTFTMSSVVSQVMGHVNRVFGRLTTHTWLTLDNLNVFSQAVHNRGAPLFNCWGFVDGTALPICRPSVDQSQYFSGHKRTQVVKYQAVMGANGINASHFPLQRRVSRPFPGKRHGAGILGESGLYSKLQRLTCGHLYCIYGYPAYPLQPLLMRPYGGAFLTEQQQLFNEGMSTIRQAVEWGVRKPVDKCRKRVCEKLVLLQERSPLLTPLLLGCLKLAHSLLQLQLSNGQAPFFDAKASFFEGRLSFAHFGL
ncbi:hypothetical protein MRX96_039718 [Rhipicephalus microplus]